MLQLQTTNYRLKSVQPLHVLWQFEGMIGWYSSSNQASPQFQPPSTLVALFSFKLCPDVLLHYYLVQFNIEVSSEDQVRVGLFSL